MSIDNSKIIGGIEICTHGCELYFVRHAQSMENIGKGRADSPLSELGIEQAKKINGKFDLVICSPLRRTIETLHHSKLEYFKLIIDDNFRERIEYETSGMLLEKFKPESDVIFNARCSKFTQTLEEHCEQVSKFKTGGSVLLIGHAYYFNSWYRRGCFPTPPNAQILRLK
jgi:phosphohistidine phosphatase SixA